jgi:hypothetical protein
MSEENKGGRPALFESNEQIEAKIQEYFKWIEGEYEDRPNEETRIMLRFWLRHPEPATITGLALYLGFESRQSFYDYEDRDQFSYTIKRARLRIEHEYEKKLSGNNVAGPIFALKNLSWKDKTEVDNRYPEGVQVVMKNANSIETK